MKRVMIGLVTGSLFLGGCAAPYSETPIATNAPTENQLQLQAASHWQLIAKDAASRLTANLAVGPLYVHQADRQSPFESAFTQQLVSSLISAGYPVVKSPSYPGAMTVEVSAEAVRFAPDRQQARSLIGAPTLLAAGLWAVGEAVTMAPGDAVGAAVLGGMGLAEAHQYFASERASGPTPRTEIIVTTRVSDASRYMAQVTSAYYTTESDYRLYAQPEAARARAVKESVSIPLHGGWK